MKTKMKKLILILVVLITYLTSFAQNSDLNGLYKNLGIKLLVPEKGAKTGTNFRLEADSIFFNGYATNLNGVKINFEKIGTSAKISFGSHFSLFKKTKAEYVFITDGMANPVSITDDKVLSKENEARFTLMLILLNYLDAYAVKSFAVDLAVARVKKCGTWTVFSYGHNSSTAMHHLAQNVAGFASSNSHCTPIGNAEADCFAGNNHACMGSQSFSCVCNVTIPYLGLGWD
jgi:hypothetical protein